MLVRRGSRKVTVLYGAVSTALLGVIAAMALFFVAPQPPLVAEFAPRAEDQIDESLDTQSSRFGDGTGACLSGQDCEGVGPDGLPVSAGSRRGPGQTVDRARVRRCVGDPPRQIEDPQSPPCVNYWEGDNGGGHVPGGNPRRDPGRICDRHGHLSKCHRSPG